MDGKLPMIGVIISTIREGRFGDFPARWLIERGASRHDLAFQVLDLRDYPLPLFGAVANPSRSDAAQRWTSKLDECDGYIFVTAEYNHSIPGVLKNALDYPSGELHRKPAAFAGYGGVGGARAVEQLRLICVEFQMAPIQAAVHIAMEPYRAVTQEGKSLADFGFLNDSANVMFGQLAWWTNTLKRARTSASTSGARL